MPATRRGPRPPRPPGDDARSIRAFRRDLSVSPFVRGDRWIGLVVAAAAIVLVWAVVDRRAGLVLGLVTSGVLVTLIVVLDGARWRAQDVVTWYHAGRAKRWVADTGGESPTRGRTEAETWLRDHGRGTVPQIYRAVVGQRTGVEVIALRELRAMPDRHPAQQAWKAWVPAAWTLERTGAAETGPLAGLVASMPEGAERRQLETWLAIAEATRRHRAGDPAWLAPLAQRWAGADRVRLGVGARVRLWFGRLAAALGIAATTLVLAVLGLGTLLVPGEYATTSFSTRGDASALDLEAVYKLLPDLARAVAAATPTSAEPEDESAFTSLTETSLPTFIWETDTIDLRPPAAAAGRHIWSVEVLVGATRPGPAAVILRFDGEHGPAAAYLIDGGTLSAFRSAFGLPAEDSP
jgi:hypothetical protein